MSGSPRRDRGRDQIPPARVCRQSLIAMSRGSTRRVALVLQTAFDCRDPVKRAAKLPALLWPDWTDLLAAKRTNRTGAAGGLSAAIAVTGTKLTRGAGLRLLDPDEAGHRSISLMSSFGSGRPEQATLWTIMRLAQYIEEKETPIGYARRRSLDYGARLPAEEWEHIAIAQNAHTGRPRRGPLARGYLHGVLTGIVFVVFAPVTARWRMWQKRTSTRTLMKVLAALDEVGKQFLQRLGIDEPVTWQTNPTDFGLTFREKAGPGDAREVWGARRPARGGLHSVADHAIKAAMRADCRCAQPQQNWASLTRAFRAHSRRMACAPGQDAGANSTSTPVGFVRSTRRKGGALQRSRPRWDVVRRRFCAICMSIKDGGVLSRFVRQDRDTGWVRPR